MMRWHKSALDIDTCHKLYEKRAIIMIWAEDNLIGRTQVNKFLDICQNDCEECYDQNILRCTIHTIQKVQNLFKIIYLKLKELIFF